MSEIGYFLWTRDIQHWQLALSTKYDGQVAKLLLESQQEMKSSKLTVGAIALRYTVSGTTFRPF